MNLTMPEERHAHPVRLPAPPANHRYVRVAADILLIAAATGLVLWALSN
jgi:Ni/Co efflux regulator RcnB